ncbi:homoaconitate hydratase [Vallitalea pronyensis]|uniref:Homoaconitate hydratase n=1 Tax=Vallitalea pronyensis TaxID=1348613 RepID=A0A8J8ML22_9FIRM|nr:homoaconitate hydratase [Vallitalea pronyensis]QUI23705.1 homoaconitate hydratase [Vallitalea pronyensis]
MARLFIVDTTLRDGEQAAGVQFSKMQKIEIAKALDQLGVDMIEAGIPVMSEEERSVIKAINALHLKAKILTWNRMCMKDIDQSLLTGVKNVHITVPASDIHIKKKLRMTRKELLSKMQKVVSYAVSKGCEVSVGAEDASRADINFLIQLYKKAQEEGAIRVRYADTVGRMNPFSVYDIIKQIRQDIKVDLDFHGHNDLGMGTANALGAFKGGATYISCSVNGLGERAGNTPLEEIVAVIRYVEGCKDQLAMQHIMKVSKMVESYSKRWLDTGKPIVGENAFSHESGIHIDGLLKDTRTYEEISPELFGRSRKIVIGKHSGKKATMNVYKDGIALENDNPDNLLELLRNKYQLF